MTGERNTARVMLEGGGTARWLLVWRTLAVLLLFASIIPLIWRPTLTVVILSAEIISNGGAAVAIKLEQSSSAFYELKSDFFKDVFASELMLFEDGKQLGPAHTPHETVRQRGQGAFSHWDVWLVFTASDNSDPRNNGRQYTYKAPLSLTPLGSYLAYGLLALAIASVLLSFRRRIISVGKHTLSATQEALRDRSFVVRTGVKLIAISAVFVLSCIPLATFISAPSWLSAAGAQVTQAARAGNYPVALFHATFLTLGIFGIAAAPFFKPRWIRIVLSSFLLSATLLDALVLNLTGQGLGIGMAETLWRETSMAPTTLGAYSSRILGGLAIFVALLAVYAMRPASRGSLPAAYATIPLIAFAGVIAGVYWTRGEMTAFPPAYSAPSQMLMVTLASRVKTADTRDRVLVAAGAKSYRKIVFIVDESVRGDYLGLNNPKFANTPRLVAMRNSIINFGTAVSGANCSAAARLFMRNGLQPRDLPDIQQTWVNRATLWNYAKAAGFKTVLIDAQVPPAPLFHSYMDASEAKAIDKVVTVPTIPHFRRDHEIPAIVGELLASDEPMFIAVNKDGVHPPYSLRYPPEQQGISEPPPLRTIFDLARRGVIADYHKSILWSVDEFFGLLEPLLMRDDTLTLYTSDHGQALFDGGYELQHCTIRDQIADGEVSVPLFAFSGPGAFRNALQSEAERSYDRRNHFEVFPTLLVAMGYDRSWTSSTFGPTLLDGPSAKPRGFLMGGFNTPGARWMKVDSH